MDKGTLVRVGKSQNVWQIVRFFDNGTKAFMVAMSKNLDGTGYERTRYIPGRVGQKSAPVSNLTEVEA